MSNEKHLIIGFAGSEFLLELSKHIVENLAFIAHGAGVLGGFGLTGIGLMNYWKESKLKDIQLEKEALELEIRKEQFKQVKLLDDDKE
jgi:hypothetical protein